MSNIYIKEPPTNGKVLLHTTVGEIDVELWSKEAPKACRNFVQLCMEGYYNNTIFHRIVKGFIVQGGDPTGTGTGGESVYGHTFKDEFHQRLKFSRRGIIAMANAGQNDNGSQFFFTLDRADELNGKHTIFGKVTGLTVFNMLKLADVAVDDNEKPIHPPRVKKIEVLANPFDDIVPRALESIEQKKKDEKKEAKSQSKATKNFKLLSFGDEAEEDEAETISVASEYKAKLKSSHDLLTNDPHLSAVPAYENSEMGLEKPNHSDVAAVGSNDEGKGSNADPENDEAKKNVDGPKDEKMSKTEELRREVAQLQKELRLAKKRKAEEGKVSESASTDAPEPDDKSGIAVAQFKNDRKKYVEKKKQLPKKGSVREEQTLALLAKFKTKLHASKSDETEEAVAVDTVEDTGWMNHVFVDTSKSDQQAKDANQQSLDTFDIFDPRNPMNKRRRQESKQKNKKSR